MMMVMAMLLLLLYWFHQDVLSSLSSFEKRKFLHFVTGSDRVPIGGLSELK